ncbi:MAG TPA: hypothetical protein VNX46_02035 [Candidatus Acidoferrum sp.]|nr:hypothetical protein [Candidatus Acidoferrum sp.]
MELRLALQLVNTILENMITEKGHASVLKNEFKEPKWKRAFIFSAGGILLAAALIRFLIAAGNAPVLAQPEPLLGIQLRYAVLFVGIVELLVALICLFGKQIEPQIRWLVWLATNLIVYWVGLLLMHSQPKSACWGTLTDPLQLSSGIAGDIVGLVPLYLVAGSFGLALSLWLPKDRRTGRLAKARESANRRDAAAGLIKMSCPACGSHIKFASSNLGQIICCPHCQQVITLRKPDLLKMVCFFCKEHIEFPAHALEQKIKCPHCKMDITLKEPI